MPRGRPQANPTAVGDDDESAESIDRLRVISTASLAALAVIAVGGALFVMRELLLPIVTAFVVGVMLSPVAKALEARRVPRMASAALIALATTLIAVVLAALIAAPIAELADKLPTLGDKLHAFDGVLGFLRRVQVSFGMRPDAGAAVLPAPSLAWAPAMLGYLSPPLTGFLYFLVVLLLFISWWPDLRRQLVMTFASRESRLRVLKILNEMEFSLASYLFTIACINLGVGAAAGLIAALTGLPLAAGFGALAATLNFIPILGPIAMIFILAVVGTLTASSIAMGLLSAGLFTLVIFVEGQFITPAIIGRRLEINALAVLLSLMFWSWMWGPMGAFLSSPLLIVALILRDHLMPDSRA